MLTPEELDSLEATLLPALERHHLRLLAHGLRTLQQIGGSRSGPPPDMAAIQAWCASRPDIGDDRAFSEAFSRQLVGVAQQLQAMAPPGRQALDLDLSDLVRWSQARAEARIAAAASPEPGSASPPTPTGPSG